MRVPCPNCDAVYEIPDAMLRGGARRLRCARCATEWLAGPAPPVAPAVGAELAVAAPTPPRPPRRAVTVAPPPARGGLALGLAWAATGLCVVGLAAGLVVAPAAVTEAFPPAARLYAMFGVAADASAASTTPAR